MALFNALLELADDHLVLGHRLSEWCGHAPMLEEDLAMPNMALDLIGTARVLYDHAGKVEGQGRDEDALAYLRGEREYRNCLLVERENGDFAVTMLRQLYFAAFMEPYWQAGLDSSDEVIKGVAGKAVKEMAYHIRHAGEWVIRLGDGTEESAARMRDAVEELHCFTEELFEEGAAEGVDALPSRAAIRPIWQATIVRIFAEAGLSMPEAVYPQTGGRSGQHNEVLGHMLAEMQSLHRAHPGAVW
ncbi:1,2-phenylacetyl-CoA epoxidase, subunit C [Pelagimonas phthalicica]|uniref:1,2-phenylacetyl-CoA epoxidase, subunit C n=1 Tax=Pelagimonas phthalicica TaxID=1037362 RepID=A0A238J8V1_9RHOB|nr:1,2-phenylacetyl-CoA epoxidase subunit PaaC [Pelagimonas phthalicica]TDS94385.1 ring-1,2-phenylacetyl-CoA epoxidase subunit PaaC [Pelagimonas phthalicica]SMX27088.1 1,2-phenylacetyl-CoA epoxidase, subunit C [Pelagimonas phthalicica]